jgi:superfamily I DNA and/or RNA helicase
VEWHEDLYDDIMPYFLRADQLPDSREHLSKKLEGCNVILSTLSFLSSTKMAEGSILSKLRPMRLLFVDEASQIHLRAYPHLFKRYGPKVGRIVFLGDHHQLPPYQGDTIVDADLSVFELEHLRRKAFLLDICYRLTYPMVAFISHNVYNGRVLCGSKNYRPRGGFLDCVSFIDVEISKEAKEGTSRMNREEIKMVTKLVAEYK